MRRYRFLRHTADAKFQAFGRTLEEAFTNAALATTSLMWDWHEVERRTEYSIRTEGRDIEQLLVNFLEEILYLLDTQMFLLGGVEDVSIQKKGGRFFLTARFLGDRNPDRYRIYGDVKAITYNDMSISKNDRYTIQVVVDM